MYLEHAEQSAYTISGTITTDGTTSAPDVYVQIASVILNASAVSDASGNFILSNIYGPDVQLYLGYDGNDAFDGIFDFNYPSAGFPKELVINGVTGDITGLDIDLSSL